MRKANDDRKNDRNERIGHIHLALPVVRSDQGNTGGEIMLIEHTPENMPEIKLHVDYSPEEPATRWSPGALAEAEIYKIIINGDAVSEDLEDLLLEHKGDDWEEEILTHAAQARPAKRRMA